jgi:hypothetical protein
MGVILSQDTYINLYSSMAEAILVDHQSDLIELYVTEENGDTRFTEEAQDVFISYCDLVESVLSDCGIEKSDGEDAA